MSYKASDYKVNVEWDERDECFIGRCPELFLGGCHGGDKSEVEERMHEIMEEVLQDLKKEGKAPPSPTVRKARFVNALEARRKTHLNQNQFAARIGVGLGTVRNWEQGRTTPKGTAATLLDLIDKDPKILEKV